MTDDAPEYLTVPELAALLRVKERKVYALASAGEIPCSRATGKLLFPRATVEAWIARHSSGGAAAAEGAERPNVFVGSHDPLLDWALRESGSGIAAFFDGSSDGLTRLQKGEAFAGGLHLYEPERDGWNRDHVADALPGAAVVLIEWAWRERGLIVASGNPLTLRGVSDLRERRVVPRQKGAGSQVLFEALCEKEGLKEKDIDGVDPPARSESDIALAVADGKADAGFGLGCVARQYRLGFVPLLRERFDIAVFRRGYFEAGFQTLLAFCRTDAFAAKARDLGGYDLSGFGRVHFNGP